MWFPHAMIDQIVICASGFGVDEDDNSHVESMAQHLMDVCEGDRVRVYYRPWDTPWHHCARWLHKQATPECRTIFLGHSYGCGWGLKRFEQEWFRKGRLIDLAILIDPVPRAFNLFFFGNLFSLTRWGVVRTRARQVLLFRQVNDDPFGRPVRLKGEDQTLDTYIYGSAENLVRYAPSYPNVRQVIDDDVGHTTIDGLPNVRRIAYSRIRQLLQE